MIQTPMAVCGLVRELLFTPRRRFKDNFLARLGLNPCDRDRHHGIGLLNSLTRRVRFVLQDSAAAKLSSFEPVGI